ncbi:MAG TPA: DNA mismatch repair protein MutS [Ferruginibacter sp.]|nr:DNA mismatch repair protein MutS [Ferruginibacter sp.]HRO16685.1 DNA mismatch repair protein MutS [Ferruginibacter sp.]HRQ19693.1 DNA mismatch repair protein MutS [Ferruginibacter sp.]
MEIDKTTIQDLAIFGNTQEPGVFDYLNHTRTVAGKQQLYKNLSAPLSNLSQIKGVAETIRRVRSIQWPATISNGTLMVVEQFMDARIDPMPKRASSLSAWAYKIFNHVDYALCRYSVEHYATFFRGLKEMIDLFSNEQNPAPLARLLETIQTHLQDESIQVIFQQKDTGKLPTATLLRLAHHLRYSYKRHMPALITAYAQLDAWYAVGTAAATHQLTEVQWTDSREPVLDADSLFHLLLPQPVPYSIHLNQHSNFLFLTSANMAGKSTFIKAIGIAVYLAHCGFPVPARTLTLSLMEGMLSNIHIADNLSKGESYFYNEVKRISNTVSKIQNGKKWLVLIDELFKGTNVQDAMKCSTVVIEGLLKIRSSLFILSTHLYEIAEQLSHHPNIRFVHFETTIENDQPVFHYTLKDGVSNDRLGYLILKQSGVVKMLNNL